MRAILAPTLPIWLALATGVQAEPSLTTTRMSCADVKAAVRKEGAVILRYPSSRTPGVTLYSRYVSDARYCDSRQTIVFASVPTADDRTCPVKQCAQIY